MRYGSSLRSPQNAGAWSRTASGPGCWCTLHSAPGPGGYPLSSTVDHDGSCVVYVLSRPGCRILGTGRHLSSDITAPACSGPSSGLGCRLYRSIGASKRHAHIFMLHIRRVCVRTDTGSIVTTPAWPGFQLQAVGVTVRLALGRHALQVLRSYGWLDCPAWSGS